MLILETFKNNCPLINSFFKASIDNNIEIRNLSFLLKDINKKDILNLNYHKADVYFDDKYNIIKYLLIYFGTDYIFLSVTGKSGLSFLYIGKNVSLDKIGAFQNGKIPLNKDDDYFLWIYSKKEKKNSSKNGELFSLTIKGMTPLMSDLLTKIYHGEIKLYFKNHRCLNLESLSINNKYIKTIRDNRHDTFYFDSDGDLRYFIVSNALLGYFRYLCFEHLSDGYHQIGENAYLEVLKDLVESKYIVKLLNSESFSLIKSLDKAFIKNFIIDNTLNEDNDFPQEEVDTHKEIELKPYFKNKIIKSGGKIKGNYVYFYEFDNIPFIKLEEKSFLVSLTRDNDWSKANRISYDLNNNEILKRFDKRFEIWKKLPSMRLLSFLNILNEPNENKFEKYKKVEQAYKKLIESDRLHPLFKDKENEYLFLKNENKSSPLSEEKNISLGKIYLIGFNAPDFVNVVKEYGFSSDDIICISFDKGLNPSIIKILHDGAEKRKIFAVLIGATPHSKEGKGEENSLAESIVKNCSVARLCRSYSNILKFSRKAIETILENEPFFLKKI